MQSTRGRAGVKENMRPWKGAVTLFVFIACGSGSPTFGCSLGLQTFVCCNAFHGSVLPLARCRRPPTSLLSKQKSHQSFTFGHRTWHDSLPRTLLKLRSPASTRQNRQFLMCDSSATDGSGDSSDAWPENQNVEVDVLVEDVDAGQDMVNNVTDSATALLSAALNPDRDPGWDEEIELSIVLCSDDHIQALNRQWRGKDAPTDVLSFVQDSSSTSDGVLGDLVISIQTAERQAMERKHSLQTELRILMVHGLLHLLGYDHEESEEELVEMADAEQRLLSRLGWEGEGLITGAT